MTRNSAVRQWNTIQKKIEALKKKTILELAEWHIGDLFYRPGDSETIYIISKIDVFFSVCGIDIFYSAEKGGKISESPNYKTFGEIDMKYVKRIVPAEKDHKTT